ncbi:MAG: hypothetical protein GY950_23205 [bacterium]|nr:hypothetical protein [bacterium]
MIQNKKVGIKEQLKEGIITNNSEVSGDIPPVFSSSSGEIVGGDSDDSSSDDSD